MLDLRPKLDRKRWLLPVGCVLLAAGFASAVTRIGGITVAATSVGVGAILVNDWLDRRWRAR